MDNYLIAFAMLNEDGKYTFGQAIAQDPIDWQIANKDEPIVLISAFLMTEEQTAALRQKATQ